MPPVHAIHPRLQKVTARLGAVPKVRRRPSTDPHVHPLVKHALARGVAGTWNVRLDLPLQLVVEEHVQAGSQPGPGAATLGLWEPGPHSSGPGDSSQQFPGETYAGP